MAFQPGEPPPKAGETMAKAKPPKPKIVYKFLIMNPAMVPSEYLTLDEKALTAYYDAEKAKIDANPAYRMHGIPGIHVAEELAEAGD